MENVLVFKDGAVGKDQRNPGYFVQLSKVLVYDPPNTPADREFLKNTLSRFGFDENGHFDFGSLSEPQQAALLDAQEAGHNAMLKFIPNRGIKVGTAVFTSKQAGDYGSDWRLRAALIFAGTVYPTI